MTGDIQASVGAGLRQILAELTGQPALLRAACDTELFGAGVGLDSLTGTLLLRRVRQRFGVDVADADLNLDCLATLGTLTRFIAEHTPSGNGPAAGCAGL